MEVNEEVAEAESPADLSGISEANKTVLNNYVAKVVKHFFCTTIQYRSKISSNFEGGFTADFIPSYLIRKAH